MNSRKPRLRVVRSSTSPNQLSTAVAKVVDEQGFRLLQVEGLLRSADAMNEKLMNGELTSQDYERGGLAVQAALGVALDLVGRVADGWCPVAIKQQADLIEQQQAAGGAA